MASEALKLLAFDFFRHKIKIQKLMQTILLTVLGFCISQRTVIADDDSLGLIFIFQRVPMPNNIRTLSILHGKGSRSKLFERF